MKPRDLAPRLPFAAAVLLLVLVALLAVLQWRWSGEVSDLERQRMRASLDSAASRFVDDVDREVTRAFFAFHAEPGETEEERIGRISREYEHWQEEAVYPRLVRELLVVRPSEGGVGVEVYRPTERRFVPASWPADLEEVWPKLREPSGPPRGGMGSFVSGELPGLIVPLTLTRPAEGGPPGTPGAELVIRFDRDVLAGEIFPALTSRYFARPEEVDYVLAVIDPEDGDRPLYVSDPAVPASAFAEGDLNVGVLGLRPFEELRRFWRESRAREEAPPWRRPRDWFGPGRPPGEGRPDGGPRGPEGPGGLPFREPARDSGAWRLVVKHRDGSLEEAVAAIRRRNLAVSLGSLALLAATAGLLMVTTQRAQRLARQQIEFVAGVTHELHTPLTAIRSAGQNLADGVVSEPTQVRRYGALVEREGRRLSNLVGQALEFAGIESGRRVYHPQAVAAPEVVEGALRDCAWLLQEKKVEVEKSLEADLPPVYADAAALRHAVANLIENAVKYGGRAGWIGLRVCREGARRVALTVTDRGPGIRKEDLPHLFEPFFRGRDAAVSGSPGNGLGLSLVRHIAEAHGGSVTVTTEAGQGSAFTLHLPVAEEPV